LEDSEHRDEEEWEVVLETPAEHDARNATQGAFSTGCTCGQGPKEGRGDEDNNVEKESDGQEEQKPEEEHQMRVDAEDQGMVAWIPVDPYHALALPKSIDALATTSRYRQHFPLFAQRYGMSDTSMDSASGVVSLSKPLSCTVGPGEVLYLPALWYHRVAQRGETIAVNYWHDMPFDHRWLYYNYAWSSAAEARAMEAAHEGGSSGT
jgi:hypothetical protein